VLIPEAISKLHDPAIKNILIVGCGGGFDFVHGMLLLPTLQKLEKKIVIGSYSFGLMDKIPPQAESYYVKENIVVKKISPELIADAHYAPEINLSRYLNEKHNKRVDIYAYYARDFTVNNLYEFYSFLVDDKQIDCIIAVDGGSDSLMVGDESGLGDIVEDLVSITAISKLPDRVTKILCAIGLGADRFNDISDGAALRAISELQAGNSFWGSISIEKDSVEHRTYKSCIDFIYANQTKRSIVSNFILSAIEGHFANETTPYLNENESDSDISYYIWPLMNILWFFDLGGVARRSDIPEIIEGCIDVPNTWRAITMYRQRIRNRIRDIENLPQHTNYRNPEKFNFTSGQIEGGYFDEILEELDEGT
jgi:hypothetical protein